MRPDQDRLVLAVLGDAAPERVEGLVLEGVARAVGREAVADLRRVEQDVRTAVGAQLLDLGAQLGVLLDDALLLLLDEDGRRAAERADARRLGGRGLRRGLGRGRRTGVEAREPSPQVARPLLAAGSAAHSATPASASGRTGVPGRPQARHRIVSSSKQTASSASSARL